jgi:hypothetical protein
MLELIALYEPLVDEEQIYSAVFLRADNYYVEVRASPFESWVWQSDKTFARYGGKITCANGKPLLNNHYINEGDSVKYFWDFVKDPETGLMEGTL